VGASTAWEVGAFIGLSPGKSGQRCGQGTQNFAILIVQNCLHNRQ